MAIIGMIFIIVAAVTLNDPYSDGYLGLYITGAVMIILGSLIFGIGCFITIIRRAAKLRKTVAEESMKYSTRSPIPCSWRLDTVMQYSCGWLSSNREYIISRVSPLISVSDILCLLDYAFQIVIDIGRPLHSTNAVLRTNQNVNESQASRNPQNYSASRVYSNEFSGV